jgi:hypothetical protein
MPPPKLDPIFVGNLRRKTQNAKKTSFSYQPPSPNSFFLPSDIINGHQGETDIIPQAKI